MVKVLAQAFADKRISGDGIGFLYAKAQDLRYFVYKDIEDL